jgi:GTP cyclohydrolase IA
MEVVSPDPQSHQHALERICRDLLLAIGEDPDRDGLAGTPRRFADWWREFVAYDAGRTDTAFESVATDQMVVVSGIRVFSLCEHHLLPFWCDVSIGYVARDKVLGLSKFARVAHQFAHRLQVQERLTHQVADEVARLTGSGDVAVLARGNHLCMAMRGIRSPATMTTSVMRGVFRETPSARDEFLRLASAPGFP